ncbi:hypothetical protein PLANTIT3_61211 [Plantibacter sp. T3]|nr:hypothetical protein PLANTIT3_61211 [Plantibacter sp. T3]
MARRRTRGRLPHGQRHELALPPRTTTRHAVADAGVGCHVRRTTPRAAAPLLQWERRTPRHTPAPHGHPALRATARPQLARRPRRVPEGAAGIHRVIRREPGPTRQRVSGRALAMSEGPDPRC